MSNLDDSVESLGSSNSDDSNDLGNSDDLKKYLPEVLISSLSMIFNTINIGIIVYGIVALFGLSGSWRSLWLLLILFALKSAQFTRD